MEQTNEQPIESIKSSKNIWTTVIAVIVTALIIGSGVYAWQRSNFKNTEQGLQQQISVLQNQISQIEQTQTNPNQQDNQPITEQEENIPTVTTNNEQNEPAPQPLDPTANWKTCKNNISGYEFKYPNNWNSPDKCQTIWKGDGFNKDNVQIVKVVYGVNADGSPSDRNSYLTRFADGGYTKTTIPNGQGYYYINETKGGPSPTIYLVSNEEIFLMSYNIFDISDTSLTEAETLFKQIIGTFMFQ